MSDHLQKIDAYLKDRLTSEERAAMERAIAEDPELKQALLRRKIELEAIDLLVAEDIRQRMRRKQKPIRRLLLRRLAIAAGLLLLIAAGLFWLQDRGPSREQLLSEYYTQPVPPDQRIPQEPTRADSLYRQGLSAYTQEADSLAIDRFATLQQDSIYKPIALNFLATLHYRRGDYDKSSEYLRQLQQISDLPASISPIEVDANLLLARYGAGDLPRDSLIRLVNLLEQLNPSSAERLRKELGG